MGCTGATQPPVVTAEPLDAQVLPAERSPTVPSDFATIKDFILAHGDKETYGNMYNDNPHYRFEGFDAYLNPEGGQKNINCDPRLSDFDEIVIYDMHAEPRYRSARHTIFEGRSVLVVKPAAASIDIYFTRMLQEIDATGR